MSPRLQYTLLLIGTPVTQTPVATVFVWNAYVTQTPVAAAFDWNAYVTQTPVPTAFDWNAYMSPRLHYAPCQTGASVLAKL